MPPRRAGPGSVRASVAFALSLACLGLGLAAWGGAEDPRLDLLTHFAPFGLAGGLVALPLTLGAAGRGGWRAWTRLAALGAMVAWGALIWPEVTRPIPPTVRPIPGRTLRLVEFNAWDDNPDPSRAVDWIDRQHPDVVVIDEMTPALKRGLIARGFVFTKGMVTAEIFSRGPARAPTFLVPMRDWKILPDFARASFVSPGGRGRFTVVNVHLNHPDQPENAYHPENFAILLDRQRRDRLIVAGDFNLTPWSFGLRRLDARLGLTRIDRAIPTWPARRRIAGLSVPMVPVLPIDHIYVGPAWRVAALRRGPDLGSDHYPLIADLVLSD